MELVVVLNEDAAIKYNFLSKSVCQDLGLGGGGGILMVS